MWTRGVTLTARALRRRPWSVPPERRVAISCGPDSTRALAQVTRCLFSDDLLPSPAAALQRASESFGFDFARLRSVRRAAAAPPPTSLTHTLGYRAQELKLDFYGCIKVVNFVRAQERARWGQRCAAIGCCQQLHSLSHRRWRLHVQRSRQQQRRHRYPQRRVSLACPQQTVLTHLAHRLSRGCSPTCVLARCALLSRPAVSAVLSVYRLFLCSGTRTPS